jgi:hypothetical protein
MIDAHAEAGISILFVSADPGDSPRLRLSTEEREIRTELQASEHRHRFRFHGVGSLRSKDLSFAVLQHRPKILHFAGHGNRAGAIFLEDDGGAAHPVQPQALADLIAATGEAVQCVVLNACYSAKLAGHLLQAVPCVIGMRRTIGDDAAIAFSIGFYQALGAGRSPQQAFDLGKAQVAMRDLKQRAIPVMRCRKAVAPRPAVAEPSRERLRLGIRSFIGHGQEMSGEADQLLALEPYFDGRRVRHSALWHTAILPELAGFLGAAITSRRPLHLNLAALPSIAFAAGYFLEAKGGFDIVVRQRGLTGTEEWRAAGGPPGAEPLWPIYETLPGTGNNHDVALAVGVTRPVLDDVRLFLDRSGIAVGKILHASLGEATAQTAVRDGAHAAQLAQSICRLIESRSTDERSAILHLFIAAPNAMVLFLGQMARGLGRIQLYDHDLEARGMRGAYIPAFELPISG